MKLLLQFVATGLLAATAMAGDIRISSLELEGTTTLPGIPLSIVARIDGDGQLPKWTALRVESGGNAPYFVGISTDHKIGVVETSRYEVSNQAQEARRLEFPVGAVVDSPWFADWRINQPGTYRIQLVLSNSREMTNGVSSPEAVFTVTEPQGNDAKVWEAMKRYTTQWSASTWNTKRGRELARLVWEQYPQSTYAPYVILLVPAANYDALVAIWDAGLAKFPSTPIGDSIRFEKAKLREQEALNEMGKSDEVRNVNRAVAATEEARALYEALSETSKNVTVQKQAQERLRLIKGRDYFLNLDRNLRAQPQLEDDPK